jgi:hypothetical protein
MKRLGFLMALAALCGALVISDSAEAYYRGFRGAGWRGGGWGWRGAGWRGARWGWAGSRWGWNRWGSNYPYYGSNYPYYGYGYGYPYGYSAAALATAPVAAAAATTAPLVTGRSVATGQVPMGDYCTTKGGVPFTNSRVMPGGQLRPYDPAIDGPCR